MVYDVRLAGIGNFLQQLPDIGNKKYGSADLMKRKIAIIFGTRPEIIKLSPLIILLKKRKIPFFCIHTGQHYSYDMDEIFFRDLEIPEPKYRLNIKSKAPYRQGDHTGRMLIAIEEILLQEMPYLIVVQGDTNTVLAGALCAEKISTTENYTGMHIKIAHVESGLRSYDRMMPEETNRFIVDHLSDFLFVPTDHEAAILKNEGIPERWIHVTGNTIVDAVLTYRGHAAGKSKILSNLGLTRDGYILLTLHRQENVDSKVVLRDILKGIDRVSRKLSLPVVFPIHPRTEKMLQKFNMTLPASIRPVNPTGFIDFLWLEANARLILTDSGGVQEEACILGVPSVTLRNNTERPQTIEVGSSVIAGTNPSHILHSAEKMIASDRNWSNPFGDGKASERILKILNPFKKRS